MICFEIDENVWLKVNLEKIRAGWQWDFLLIWIIACQMASVDTFLLWIDGLKHLPSIQIHFLFILNPIFFFSREKQTAVDIIISLAFCFSIMSSRLHTLAMKFIFGFDIWFCIMQFWRQRILRLELTWVLSKIFEFLNVYIIIICQMEVDKSDL